MNRDARRIAGERTYNNRHSETHSGVLDDNQRIDEDGVLGEIAFAEMFHLARTPITRHGPVTFNFRLRDGSRVDVRSSRAQESRLIVPPAVARKGTIDVFVLAQIVIGTYFKPSVAELVGWATLEDVLAAPVRRISKRPNAQLLHVLTRGELRNMDELLKRHVPHTLSMF